MKIVLYCLIGILAFSCGNIAKPSKETLSLEYVESRKKTIDALETIWACENPMLSSEELDFNGEISYNILISISDFEPIDFDKKQLNIQATTELIQRNISNYRKFSKLRIITSYANKDGERNTSSTVIKIKNL